MKDFNPSINSTTLVEHRLRERQRHPPRPQHIRAFDFMGARGRIPRIAAAVGREVVIFYIGVE